MKPSLAINRKERKEHIERKAPPASLLCALRVSAVKFPAREFSAEGMSERRSRFDNLRGLGAGYGVPALAGSALSLGGGSKHLEIHGETPSHRLKPGIHTLRLFSFIRDAEYQKLAAWDKNVLPALTRPRSGQECPRSPPQRLASSRNDYTACPPATGAAIITYRILNKERLYYVVHQPPDH